MGDTIYRTCRLRAQNNTNSDCFNSAEKAAQKLSLIQDELHYPNCHVSHGSIKDYESGKTVPSPETVKIMAEAYQTPELKWLHCTYGCPLGKEITHTKENIGTSDIYKTYFELVGAFNLVGRIENQLHDVLEDDTLTPNEGPAMDEILSILDRITESSKELKIWAERQKKNMH
jgi:transcriptional regulator with XRE-family HTH domain